MAYIKQAWQSNELLTSEKLNHMEDGIVAAKTSEDIVNNLSETTPGKVLDATQGKVLNDSKLGNNFSFLSVASTPYSGNEQIALYSGGENYSTTVNELLRAAGGSGSSQSALVNYVKNCGTISSLPQTISDANITSDMVVLEAVLGAPSAQTSDWSVSTANGSVTISGSISDSTTLILYFGVGMTTAPSIMTNLASTRSDNILKTAPRPGVMGTLGYANGGTNVVASSKQDLLDKMGVTDAIAQSAAKISNIQIINGFNTDALNIDIGFTATNRKNANALLFNSNQASLAMLRLDLSPSIAVINGDMTYTITRTGSVYTVTPSSTLWGVTTVIIGNN